MNSTDVCTFTPDLRIGKCGSWLQFTLLSVALTHAMTIMSHWLHDTSLCVTSLKGLVIVRIHESASVCVRQSGPSSKS